MILFVIVIVVGLGFQALNRTNYIFTSKDIMDYSQNWKLNDTFYNLEGQKLSIPNTESYTLSKQLPQDYEKGNFLLMRGSLADVTFVIEDQIIYQSVSEHTFFDPMASLWHIVELPKGSIGKELSITIHSPYNRMNGLLNSVYLGHNGDLVYYITSIFGPAVILDLIIILIGLLMLVVAFINPQKVYNNMFHIGMFSILVGLWLIAESKMLQVVTGSTFIIGSMAYLCLPIIPIPLIRYVKSVVSEKSGRSLSIALNVCRFNLVLIICLQLFHIADYFETVNLSHIVIFAQIILVAKILYTEIKINHNRFAKHFLFSLLTLFSFIIIELVRFHFINVANVTVFVRLGLLIFIVTLSFNVLRQLITLLRKSYQAEYYEKLALLDQLTKGPNRTAFERDLEGLFRDPDSLNSLHLMILDMNNLKTINDTHGHIIGDEAIKNAYWVIHDSFSQLGKSYRIGGDEFAVIIQNYTPVEFNQACEDFYLNILRMDGQTHYPFSIAFGSVMYDASIDTTAEKMMHRADKSMYHEKKVRYK